MQLFPRILLANTKNTLALRSDDFKDGENVVISVQSMEKYNVPHSGLYRIDEDTRFEKQTKIVKNGAVIFDFTPIGEQRHRVYAEYRGEKYTFEIYSLLSDLYALNAYKGDGHIHSTASDGLSSPLDTAAAYYAAGFDYIALTDHHKYAPSRELSEQVNGVLKHFRVYCGEEVHNRDMGYFHIINFGAKDSVNEIINADPDGVFRKIAAQAGVIAEKYSLPESLDKKEFAFRLWVSENIRKFGGVSVLCHPYWDAYGEYNMQSDMLYFLLKNHVFDAFEVVDDVDRTGNGVNLQTALYQQLRADGVNIPIVGSSDCHDVNGDIFGKYFTYAFCDNVEHIKEAITNFKTVAVERIGTEYRVYGDFRLIKYTRFLIDNFEPNFKQIREKNVALFKRAIEERSAELAGKLEKDCLSFRNLFFGNRA